MQGSFAEYTCSFAEYAICRAIFQNKQGALAEYTGSCAEYTIYRAILRNKQGSLAERTKLYRAPVRKKER